MEPTKILIVEDELIVAEDLRVNLVTLGYEVLALATSGEEAITLTGLLKPDVVLMDIQLKGKIDGIESARQIQDSSGLPVVFLTSHSDEHTFQRAKVTEPYGYITKPYRPRELQIAIEMAIYKHRAEKELKRTQRLLATTLRSIEDAVISTDAGGRIMFMNPAAEAMIQRKKEECLGEPLAGLFTIINSETTEPILDVIGQMPLDDITTTHRDVFLVLRNGIKISIDHSVAPIRDERNTLTGFVFVLRDATERRKAEVQLRGRLRSVEIRYRTLIEQIPAVTYIAVPGDFVYVSPQLEKILGSTPEDWLADPQEPLSQLHPDDAAQVVAHRLRAFEKGGAFQAEYRMVAKDGTAVWLLDTASVIKDDQGNPLFLQGVMLDITDRIRAENQLLNSNKKLRALSARLQSIREEERTRIAREIHDDLGQSLTAIKINLSFLNKNLAESPIGRKKEFLGEVADLSGIVDSAIKTVQQLASELRPGMLDHLGLKSAMEWQMNEFQTRTGINCRYECNVENIEIDSERATAVFRIFQETLTNVVRHSSASEVLAQVQLTDHSLLLEVVDNGIGISESAISDPKALGLLGMQERTLLLGGEFKVSGQQGKGTTVLLKLPL